MLRIVLYVASLVLLVFGGCLMGCTSKTSGQAEWRIEVTNGIVFKTTAVDTDGTQSKAGIDAEDWTKAGIADWLFGADKTAPVESTP